MYHYDLKSIISKPILKQVLTASDLCMITLFHGTDSSVLQLPLDERAHLRECCSEVIDCLLPVYQDNGFENLTSQTKQNILGNAYGSICNAYSKAMLRQNNCALYQYTIHILLSIPAKPKYMLKMPISVASLDILRIGCLMVSID